MVRGRLPGAGDTPGNGPAGGSPATDQVEEDWQLVVANPDPTSSGPQITTCMSPSSDPTASFVTFYVNYQDYPDWQPGGMQVKAYGATPSGSSSPSRAGRQQFRDRGLRDPG